MRPKPKCDYPVLVGYEDADAFAVVTAIEYQATLLTDERGDEPLVGEYELKVQFRRSHTHH